MKTSEKKSVLHLRQFKLGENQRCECCGNVIEGMDVYYTCNLERFQTPPSRFVSCDKLKPEH